MKKSILTIVGKAFLSLVVMTALLAPTAARGMNGREGGNTLSVGTMETTSVRIPYWTFYGEYAQKNEFVYPAELLTDMANQEINSMTFLSTTNDSRNVKYVQVRIKEVGFTAFEGASYQATDGTIVFEGTVEINQGVMTVNFEKPYLYQGGSNGNLLIGFYTLRGDLYSDSYNWHGWEATHAALAGYSTNFSSISATYINFLPYVTFVYQTPPACARPSFSAFTISAAER